MKKIKISKLISVAKNLRMKRKALMTGAQALTGVSMLVGGMEISMADTIIQYWDPGVTSNSNAGSPTVKTKNFNLFDSTLGILNEVTIVLSNGEPSTLNSTVTGTVNFTVAGNPDISNSFGYFNGLASESYIYLNQSYSASELDPWKGGGTFELKAAVSNTYGDSPFTTTWSPNGGFALTYVYAPSASVPAPSGLALAGLGVALLGIQRQRKRKQSES